MWRIFKKTNSKPDELDYATVIRDAEYRLAEEKSLTAVCIADVSRMSLRLLELLETRNLSLGEFLQDPRNATLASGWHTKYVQVQIAKTLLRSFYVLIETAKTEQNFGNRPTDDAHPRSR